MIIMSKLKELNKYEPFSNKRMFGFGLGFMMLTLMWGIRGMIQIYSEKALKLPILTVFIIMACYSIWDAVNDPLTGYLLDRSKKFTSKRGKRFPFIIIGVIGASISLILLFLPISFDPLIASIWIFLMLIIWDQFQTIWELSSSSLTVDIFRDQKQRVKYGAVTNFLDGVGSVLRGFVIPITLAIYGGESSATAYFLMTIILCVFILILAIPYGLSIREPEEMIELRTRLDEEGKSTSPFKEIMKRVFTDKNWMSFIIAYVAFVVNIGCVTVGIYYYTVDGLGLPVETVAIFNLAFLAVSFISIPFWIKIIKKIGARKTFFYALVFGVFFSPLYLIFGWEFTPALLIGMLGGIGLAGQGVAFNSVYSQAIDNATVQTGKREESSYLGVLRFFSATAILWQILIFMLVAMATGYDATIDYDYAAGIVPSQMARIGLNLQITIIPSVIQTIGALIFFKFNKITSEVAIENKKKIIEMGL